MKNAIKRSARSVRHHPWLALSCALLLSAFAASFLTAPAYSGFTSAIRTSSNSIGTGTAFVTVKDSGNSNLCSSVPSGSVIPSTSAFDCTGSAIPATVPASQTSTNLQLVHSGSQGFGGANVSGGACYPRVFANSASAANPLLLRYGVASNQDGPAQLSGSASAAFDGVSAQATSNVPFNNPQTFTVGAWFKTTTKRGTIIGFSNSASAGSVSNYDRLLFMDNSGNVVWDTVPGGGAGNVNDIASSGTNYADGNWHFALGVAQAGNPNSTIALYVDGALANSKSISQTISAEAYVGYWRIGYSPQDSRANSGGAYFAGNISNVAYLPSALTASQVTTLWQSTSQANFESNIMGLGASAFWPIGAESVYTGSLAGANPCSSVELYAAGSDAGNLGAAPSAAIPALAAGQTQTLAIGLATNGNYSTYAAGIHLDVALNVAETKFPQTFRWVNQLTVLR